MIKKNIKKYLPTKYFDSIRMLINKLNFFSYLLYDYNHIFKNQKKKGVKTSNIIRQYHRLEKAMSKMPYDSTRGFRAANTLLGLLEKYDNENNIKDIQFNVGLNVLEKFFLKNKDLNSPIYKRLKQINNLRKDIKVGIESTPKSYFLENSLKNFKDLSTSRKSVRYFSNEKVDINKVKDALDIAKKTPSVCNRQGWHTWVITDESIINHFKKIHNGFSLQNQNLTTLLVVTFDKNSFDYPMERNQGFTDAGLYSMSVMYALTYKGLASCPLNSNFYLKDKKKFKTHIGISDNFTIAMFIAVGNYLDNNISPISYRYSVDDKATFI